MIHLPEEPLWPNLLEIVQRPEAANSILAGGLGLRLKEAHLSATRAKTLFDEIPELRPTVDIDLFLRIDLWIDGAEARNFREMLDELGYQPVEENWQFEKPLISFTNKTAKLDLMARQPLEAENVRVKPPRVGAGLKTGIHGRLTEEAFAIDDFPIQVQLNSDGGPISTLLAHPFAYLNLKVAAAKDWALELDGKVWERIDENGNRIRQKHVADVYAIVGMMTEEELRHARELAGKYADHPKSKEIRVAARELYGTRESPGSIAIRNYQDGAWAEHFDANYEPFWDAQSQALGIV